VEGFRGVKSKEMFPAIFSRHAAAYQQRLNDIMARGEARGRQRVIDLLEVKPGMHVLDLACGPGTLSRPLAAQAEPGGELVGIDLAPGMIELARSAAIRNARFEVMDIEQLAFPDASFDAVACGHGLQFLPDLPRALREIHRVLRIRSRFAASVPLNAGQQGPWMALDEVVTRWLPPAPVATDQQPTRAVVGDADAFRQAALDAGFVEARVELVEETVTWQSAEQMVGLCMSWWDLAARVERLDAGRRQAFIEDAVASLQRDHPGAIETVGRNHVLIAVA
jgi:ubiquinone/menaquinone biosynthesis C-methylase UbiE